MTEDHPSAPPPGEPAHAPPPVQRRSNGGAITALVCGIIAILLFWIPGINLLAILLGLVAIVAGVVGLSRARDPYVGGKGMAVTGLVLGILALVLSVLVLVGLARFFGDPDVQREFQERIQELQTEAEAEAEG